MKVIPKLQRGGSFDPYFTIYNPVPNDPNMGPPQNNRGGHSRRVSEEDSEKGMLTEKDFFGMLKEIDGLPNEMMSIVKDLTNTFRLKSLTGIGTDNLSTMYLMNLYHVKVASQNKQKYDTAMQNAQNNGALAEPAISMDGKLVAQDKNGEITTVSLDDYLKNSDDYSIMSVTNLAHQRAYDPKLAGNQSAIDIINNSMGFESFQKLLSQAKQSLGTSEVTRNGYFTNEGEASKGLKLLQTLSQNDQVQALGSVTAQGLYEYKIIDKNQLNQLNALTSYIVATLPDRAKTWAAFKMGTSDKNKATKDLVFQYLLSGTNNTNSFDINYKGSMDKVEGRTKGSTSKEEEPKMTYLTAVQNGYGNRRTTRTLNPGTQGSFSVNGTAYGAFLGQDQKTVSDLTLQDLLDKTGLGGISNPRSITFGEDLINPNLLSKIAVENTGGFQAILPCIREGDTVRPDFDLIRSFDDVVQEVSRELGDASTYEERQSLLEKKIANKPELQDLLNMSGKLDPNKVAPFFIVDGLASDQNFSFEEKSPMIHFTDDQNDIDYFKTVTQPEKFDDDDSWWGDHLLGTFDKVYKGSIYIPIQSNNRLAALLFSKQQVKDSTARAIEQEYQKAQLPSMRSADTNYLFQ